MITIRLLSAHCVRDNVGKSETSIGIRRAYVDNRVTRVVPKAASSHAAATILSLVLVRIAEKKCTIRVFCLRSQMKRQNRAVISFNTFQESWRETRTCTLYDNHTNTSGPPCRSAVHRCALGHREMSYATISTPRSRSSRDQ